MSRNLVRNPVFAGAGRGRPRSAGRTAVRCHDQRSALRSKLTCKTRSAAPPGGRWPARERPTRYWNRGQNGLPSRLCLPGA